MALLVLVLGLVLALAPGQARAAGAVVGPDDGRQSTVTGHGGVPLHVVEYGPAAGRPLLLVHGANQSWLTWQNNVTDLAARGFHVVTFDLRGHARSGVTVDFSRAAYDGDTAAVVAATHLDRPIVVGWSMGSYVAASYAASAPIRGLVPVDGAPNAQAGFLLSPPTTDATVAGAGISPAGQDRFFDLCYAPRRAGATQRAQQLTENHRQSPATFDVMFSQAAASFATVDLGSYRSGRFPVLAVAGSADQVLDATEGARQIVAEVPAGLGRVLILPGEGHTSFATAPDTFDAALDGFAAGAGV